MIRIDLDSIRKDLGSGASTILPRARVSSDGRKHRFEAVGSKASLQAVCGALRALGVEGQARVYRGETEVFAHPISIESMAKGVASEKTPEQRKAEKNANA